MNDTNKNNNNYQNFLNHYQFVVSALQYTNKLINT